MPPRKAARTVEPVLEMPDDSVTQPQLLMARKERMQEEVKWDHLRVAVHVVPYLPADAPADSQNPHAFGDDRLLQVQVLIEGLPSLIRLAVVVRW